jgi:hypothetical protein
MVNYCPFCTGGYYHTVIGGHCYTKPGVFFPNYNYNYVYVPGYGYVYGSMAVSAPYTGYASGKVAAGTEMTLKCSTAGATIYYTIDGREPSATAANLYTGETITINRNTTIRAIAFLDNGLHSTSVTLRYTVGTP